MKKILIILGYAALAACGNNSALSTAKDNAASASITNPIDALAGKFVATGDFITFSDGGVPQMTMYITSFVSQEYYVGGERPDQQGGIAFYSNNASYGPCGKSVGFNYFSRRNFAYIGKGANGESELIVLPNYRSVMSPDYHHENCYMLDDQWDGRCKLAMTGSAPSRILRLDCGPSDYSHTYQESPCESGKCSMPSPGWFIP